MIRWVIVIFVALVVLPALIPELQKLGVWRTPGDIRFRVRGFLFCLPFGSTLIVSLLVLGTAKLLAFLP
ncbi:MAG: hypothetical protein K0R10_2514 [Alphaproteobacteria bacterium]|jgi:hypothetical protein|nr:hypothetical protein [Alphaproteobacteria bacterium]